MDVLEELNIKSWTEPLIEDTRRKAMQSLEEGKILYMPSLSFALQKKENLLLTQPKLNPKRKNISYDLKSDRLAKTSYNDEESEQLKEMLQRYALLSSKFLKRLLPFYKLSIARTSFRPTEIKGRKSSLHKDDTKLHVDAFPSNPTQGRRILRLFTNINPEGIVRVWKVGEPFEKVAQKFAPKVPKPLPGSLYLLKLLKITKNKRTLYDHYMFHIHNLMKEDSHYQQTASQKKLLFPAGSSWAVFTDQVSHAALSGQHVLEQTFSVDLESLQQIKLSPLKILESLRF